MAAPANTRASAQTPVGLASWLGGGSVFLVLLAVAAIALSCAILLGRQVRQQALVRAQLAVTSAREQLRRDGEDLLANARDLAERPELARLLSTTQATPAAVLAPVASGTPAAAAAATPAAPATPAAAATPATAAPSAAQLGGLTAYLGRFNEATSIDASALLRGTTLVAHAGPVLNWAEIITAMQEQGERFVLAPSNGGALLWGAAAPVQGTSVRVITLRQSTPALLAALGTEVGATLQLVNFATYHAPPDDELTPLHTQVLAMRPDSAAAAHLPHGDWYAASLAIATQSGEVMGLLDAQLSGATFEAAVRSFDRGDFSAAIPAVAPLEVGALARSMDEMRRRLVDLTDALRRREAEAQAVLAGVVEGVFAVDDQRRIRYANAQVARLLRRSPNDIVGQFCGDVLRPLPVEGERPCERHCPIIAARTSTQASARELLCLSEAETRSTIVLSAPPIQGIQVQILRDETDLEAARRARDSVLGNISHEFRTPLAAQLASIELLRDGLGAMSLDAQQELLANVERGVLRLMRLIDNLLESVRIEAGQLSIRRQPVRLSEVVAEAQDLIAPLLRQRNLSVELDQQALGVEVSGDAQRLIQVFVNLLANAIKFAPEGSTLRVGGTLHEPRRIGTGAEQAFVEAWVEDEGPGIADGSASTIFERFQRGAGTEPEAPGLGLGLWIVKSIIERHGGSVRVERTSAGRTRFSVLLPQSQAADVEPAGLLT